MLNNNHGFERLLKLNLSDNYFGSLGVRYLINVKFPSLISICLSTIFLYN